MTASAACHGTQPRQPCGRSPAPRPAAPPGSLSPGGAFYPRHRDAWIDRCPSHRYRTPPHRGAVDGGILSDAGRRCDHPAPHAFPRNSCRVTHHPAPAARPRRPRVLHRLGTQRYGEACPVLQAFRLLTSRCKIERFGLRADPSSSTIPTGLDWIRRPFKLQLPDGLLPESRLP
jgi:hypothetical protein